MEALGLATALLAGYVFAYQYPPARYVLLRSKGWSEYGHLLKYGVYFSIISALEILIVDYFDLLAYILGDLNPILSATHLKIEQVKFIAWAMLCLVQAQIAGFLSFNRIFVRKGLRLISRENVFEELIFESSRKQKPIQITLSNRKVYVGIVVETTSPLNATECDFFSIFPLLSGYRNENTLNIEFTNSYISFYSRPEAIRNLEEKFKTVIISSTVVSMAWFDFDSFEGINDSHKNDTSIE